MSTDDNDDQARELLRAAIAEAEEEALNNSVESRFYAMGLRVAAGLLGMPEGVDPQTRRRRAPDPMPVFVIKGKDALALRTIEFYRRQCLNRGLMEQAREVEQAYDEVDEWQERNSSTVKLPDHRHVPVSDR